MPDYLPPGNTPIVTESDPADQIAAIARETYDALWPRTILKYANTAERDADLAGLAPTDAAFAHTLDTGFLWYWSGSAWKVLSGTSAEAPLTLSSGWVATTGYTLASRVVWSGGQGVVHVRGAATRTTGNIASIATLSSGHRPGTSRWLSAAVTSLGNTMQLNVTSTGVVNIPGTYAVGSLTTDVVPVYGTFPL